LLQRHFARHLSDNYFSLLPGEKRVIDIEYPAAAAHGTAQVMLRGWNLSAEVVSIH
jgi:hypothetical protein